MRKDRRISITFLTVLNKSENNQITCNGSREEFRGKMGNMLLSKLCGHGGGGVREAK